MMAANRAPSWQRDVDRLVRVAEAHRGTPMGAKAREQLLGIINVYPEVARYGPVDNLLWKDIMIKYSRLGKMGYVH